MQRPQFVLIFIVAENRLLRYPRLSHYNFWPIIDKCVQLGIQALDPIKMMIYRPGAVTAEQIAEVAGSVEVFRSSEPLRETPTAAMPSPGVGLKHYAPRARLVLVEAAGAEFVDRGVRRRARTTEEIATLRRKIHEISERSAAMQAKLPPFTEADLYDENGL